MPNRWFLALVVAAVLVGGVVAARGPRPEGPPARRVAPAPAEPFLPAGTPQSGRFRFVDLTGQPAPDFTLSDLEAKSHTLRDHRGTFVMLVFWATWCKTCPIELTHVAYIAHALAPKGLVTLSINWEKDLGPVRKMAREAKMDLPILRDLDQKTRYDYDVFSIPRVVIVDRTGKIAAVIRGYQGEAGPIVKALADQGLVLPGLESLVKPVPVEKVPVEGD